MRTRSALVLVAAAALFGACSDPAPRPSPPGAAQNAAPQGAPIDGAPIDSGPAAPPQPVPADPSATAVEPPIGDVSTPGERAPEDRAVTTAPPARAPESEPPPPPVEPAPPAPTAGAPAPPPDTAPAAPAAPDTVVDTALPSVPTNAGQADKPEVPEKPAAPAAAGAAKSDPAKSFLPKDRKKGEPVELTWDQLASFEFIPPPPVYSDPETGKFPDQTAANEKASRQIPAEIWDLEGETITVEGYMIPLEYADEGVRSFLVSRHAMGCCFGVMPRPHELVECDMGDGKTVPYVGYLPVKVTGTFHVGLKAGPSVILSGIYRMDAPKMTVPKER